MKRIVLLIVLFLLFSFTSLFGYTNVNSSTATNLDISVDIPEVKLIEREYRDGNTYSSIIIPHAGKLMTGKPDLPGLANWILIPNGTNVSISTYPGSPLVFENVDIAPLQPEPYDNLDSSLPPFEKDKAVYSRNADYPGTFAEVEPTKRKRGQECTILWIYPYQYNPVERTLYVYPDLDVSISFNGVIKPIPANLVNERQIKSLMSFAINVEEVLQAELSIPQIKFDRLERTDGCELLIITDPSFNSAANTLADWKTKRGILTKVRSTSTTGTTASSIENYIDNAYDTWTPAPSYLLFIGDTEYIPTWHTTPHPSGGAQGHTGSDFEYADYDDPCDFVADFGYGRLSVDTADEVDSLVARIIRYERSPTTNSSYYTDILNVCTFQDGATLDPPPDDEPDQIENRRFCKTSEDIRNYLHDEQGYPWSQREYSTHNPVNADEISPRWWNNITQPSTFIFENDLPPFGGVEIPASLQRPTFPWDGDSSGISTEINSGVFFSYYRAHGARNGWSGPTFSNWNVDNMLFNGEDRPVIWSITCQSGWFDNETDDAACGTLVADECFAEHWIRHNTGGSCGILAASRISMSGPNDRLSWGMMDAIWPSFLTWALDPWGGSTPIYRMGDVLNYGMVYMNSKYSGMERDLHNRLYHWFGDPTMEMWTSQPNQLTRAYATTDLEIGTISMTVAVEPSIEDMLVCAYTDNSDEIFATATTNGAGYAYLTFDPLTVEPIVQVTVTKHNYLPYEFEAGLHIWEGDLSTDWDVAGNWLNNDIPDSDEYAFIPAGKPRYPLITSIHPGSCGYLEVEDGASITISGGVLTVYEDFETHGLLVMDDPSSHLIVQGDLIFMAASSADITNDGYMTLLSDLYFYVNSDIDLTSGAIYMEGSDNSSINTYTATSINNFVSGKDPSHWTSINTSSTANLTVNGWYRVLDGSTAYQTYSGATIFKDDIYVESGGVCYFENGTARFSGDTQSDINFNGTDSHFNDLRINKTTGVSVVLDSDITVEGDLTIAGGKLSPGSMTINLEGDWINSASPLHFQEGTSRVIFNGSEDQNCDYNENFNILEVDNGNRLDIGTAMLQSDVYCSVYDWSSGGINVTNGSFSADSLANNGIAGHWFVSSFGTANLSNPNGRVHLKGHINMVDGSSFNVYGGTMLSYWPFGRDASISMSGGTLTFHDQGVLVYAGTHSLTEDITGGAIKVARGFRIERNDFTPEGGLIELIGTVNGQVSVSSGSNFCHLKINKTSVRDKGSNEFKNTTSPYHRTLQVTATTNLDINGSFTIENGTFIAPDIMKVQGNWNNSVGPDAFEEGSGLVVFDSTSNTYCESEVFNNLQLRKVYPAYLRLSAGDSLICNSYNWTVGTLYVTGGSFTALDMVDTAILGTVEMTSGTINFYQDVSQFIDLSAELIISGGEMHIYGGSDDSYWPAGGGNVIITMSDGIIAVHDVGIHIDDPNYFNDDITGGSIITGGDLTCERSDFTPSAGTFIMDSSSDASITQTAGSFFNLEINKAASRSNDIDNDRKSTESTNDLTLSQQVTLSTDIQLLGGGTLTVNEGSLYLNGYTISTTGDVVINDSGILNINDNASLKVGDGYTLTVNSGGRLEVMGSTGNRATITHNTTGYYDFNIESGGTVSADYGLFSYMDSQGLRIKNGALIDPINPFNNSKFNNGIISGTLLTINNDENHAIYNAIFPDNTWTGDHNVAKLQDHGQIYFIDATGLFSGEDYDNDPNDRIHWSTGLPEIDDLTITYNAGTDEIELNWTYPFAVDQFKIYRSTDPYDFSGATIFTTSSVGYSEPATGTKYFYYVVAEKIF